MEPPGRYVDEEQDIEKRKEMPTGNSNHPNELSPPPVPVVNNPSHFNSQQSRNQSSAAHSSGSSPSSARSTLSNTDSATTSQPSANYSEGFNTANNFRNKVKKRFQGQPDTYKQFLRILQTFQKEQRYIKDGVLSSANLSTLCQMFADAAELFDTHEDLFLEFLQLLSADNAPVRLLSPVPVANSQSHSNPQHLYNQSSEDHSSDSSPSSAHSIPSNTASATTSQPSANYNVELIMAVINYLNKVENRFEGQPDVYVQFLDIIHIYQIEQRMMKDGESVENPLTKGELHARVAKLFQDQEDLLKEFSQFLPDANALAGLKPAIPE